MPKSITISKNPVLSPASNYEWLRTKGMEYIEQLGSSNWTDYNIHDPGITLLEILCYAITDLGYRTALPIQDLLAEPATAIPKQNPARQGFFTAREILTINPWTTADFRKLLIDINGIKNAWLRCKQCACNDLLIYAKCSNSTLQYNATEHSIVIKGFYDVWVEFENDEQAGDLNSGKIKYNFLFAADSGIATAMIEMRLPTWQQLQNDLPLLNSLRIPGSKIETVSVDFISGNKNDNQDVPADQLANVLRRPLYATIKVGIKPDENLPGIVTLNFSDIPFTVWFSSDAHRKSIQLADIKTAMEDASVSGIFGKYRLLIKRANTVMASTRQCLHQHRNLSEDFCNIQAVPVQDMSVCADMEVTPAADIEAILAEAYYRIDQYMSADIKFYSLKELTDAGVPVDEIFDGPKLSNGFINNQQLETTQLKQYLYTSDIINLLMDIPGVLNIKNFVITQFDEDGKLVASEKWMMPVAPNHQPRMYMEAAKILVFKNGLPFLPDKLELSDTLQVIKGQHAQPKYSVLENDLPVPEGKHYQLTDYYPLQYSLPLTYGVCAEGLPGTASVQRQAQAKQLKAYLLFYEQLLVNYLQQLSHVKDLFALDESVTQTYFTRLFTNADINHITDIQPTLTQDILQAIAESPNLFTNRRNRFLDHLLARFAENFNEYALMLYAYSDSRAAADSKLINDKIDFGVSIPEMSANRARAFNYKDETAVCSANNVAGLELRIKRLLGMNDFGGLWSWHMVFDANGNRTARYWKLSNNDGNIVLMGANNLHRLGDTEANTTATNEIALLKKHIGNIARYQLTDTGTWYVSVTDENGIVLANHPIALATQALAEVARDNIIDWSVRLLAADKVLVVEHLLLRPRNAPNASFPNGDPLLSICIPAACSLCGEEDPYSFRLTIVLSGETGIANSGMAFRRFAEATIRKEIPAHLAIKICWVADTQLLAFEELYCSWLSELAKEEPDANTLHLRLTLLLAEFEQLKSVYPEARLHDCIDGDDSNRVFLDNTII